MLKYGKDDESNIENEVRDRESYEVAQHFGSINVASSRMIGMFGLAIFMTRPKSYVEIISLNRMFVYHTGR